MGTWRATARPQWHSVLSRLQCGPAADHVQKAFRRRALYEIQSACDSTLWQVYSAEAQWNPQRWLQAAYLVCCRTLSHANGSMDGCLSGQEPDFWNAHFTALMQQGLLNICLTEESCQDLVCCGCELHASLILSPACACFQPVSSGRCCAVPAYVLGRHQHRVLGVYSQRHNSHLFGDAGNL